MKNKTLGEAFADLRGKSHLAMLDVANHCDLSEAVVWKLERDRPVRWETVHLILTQGVNVPVGSAKYQAMHKLWLAQRQEHAEAKTPEHAAKTLSKHAVEATRKFRNLIRELDPAMTRKVLAGAQRAAARLGTESDA